MPQTLQAPLNDELKRLLRLKIIRQSTSAFASPAFPLLKKNGNVRLVVDYRQLNSLTITDSYPFPSVHDQLIFFSGAKIFSRIDFNNGYYQIAVDEKIIGKTAFV